MAQSVNSTNTPLPIRRLVDGSSRVSSLEPSHAAVGNTTSITTHSVGNTHHVMNDHQGTLSDANPRSSAQAIAATVNAAPSTGRARIRP